MTMMIGADKGASRGFGFHKNSILIIDAPSINTIKTLLRCVIHRLPMPEYDDVDWIEIFLRDSLLPAGVTTSISINKNTSDGFCQF
jgi:hypothetical protein